MYFQRKGLYTLYLIMCLCSLFSVDQSRNQLSEDPGFAVLHVCAAVLPWVSRLSCGVICVFLKVYFGLIMVAPVDKSGSFHEQHRLVLCR